ncbi:MAG: TRAP transporter small permease subunit [Myxococcota bacterium]
MSAILRLDRLLARVEAAGVGLVLSFMILASAAQWLIRTAGATTSGEVEILVRFGVLWMAALGGALATQRQRHLAIDAVVRVLPQGSARIVGRASSVLAAAMCAGATHAAAGFVREEWAFGRTQAGLPEAALLSILPVAFALMSFHFLVGVLRR